MDTSPARTHDDSISPGAHIAFGILEIVLGALTIVFALLTTALTIMVLGAVIAGRGFVEGLLSTRAHGGSYWWRLAGGVLGVVIGLFFVSRPFIAAEALTFLLAALFITIGLFRTIAGTVLQVQNKGLVIVSGIASLVVGGIILAGLPQIGFWLIGTLVGVEFIADGIISVVVGTTGIGVKRGSPQSSH